MLAKGVKEAFEYEKALDRDFQWGIENPAYGDLPRRDYMQPEQWKPEYAKVSPLDMCAYGGKYKAPKVVYYTSMTGYVPEGRTGDGKCNQGKCGQGEVNPATQHFVHYGKLGRDAKDGP